MKIENVLVIGLGEIGAPLLQIVKGVYHAEGLDIEPKKIGGPVDVLHVCFPYSEDFVEIAAGYVHKFQPKLAMIESTVLPYTTNRIYERTRVPICHSPVRGRQADGIKWAYFTYTKFIGPVRPEFGRLAREYYKSLGFRTYICTSPLETEFMKIIDTTYYGLMIAWFQEIHRMCKQFNLKEEEIIDFFKTNERDSGGKHPRPVYYPGFIGGHCVIPNTKLLSQMYPSSFIDVLQESNKRRKKEMESEKKARKNKKTS